MRFAIVAVFLLLANCGANPAFAHQRHHRAPVAPVPSFFSFFQVPLVTPALQQQKVKYGTRRVFRHTAHVRRRGETRTVVSSVGAFTAGNGGFGNSVVETARSQIGNGAVYGRKRLWCARFMNYVLERTGHRGTGSDMARSFTSLPRTDLHVGAIAVFRRRGGGHVGVVSGVTAAGDPVVISGNHGGRVRESVYSRRRVVAFVEAR